MYQAFPNPTLAERAPKSVQRAASLMYAGAVVYLISGIVGLVSFVTAPPGPPASVRVPSDSTVAGDVSAAASVLLVTGAVISIVVPILLWLWMAWKCRAGRPWARVVSTVLFGIATVATLTSLAGSTSAWGLFGAIMSWFIGLGAVILLWQRSSSSYFRTARRY